MRILADDATPAWRAPLSVGGPWGKRQDRLCSLIVAAWREAMDVYARAGGCRFPSGGLVP